MAQDLPETLTVREFATLMGFKPNYGHQLKADGRLVLTDDGKRVKVADSIARVKATADPSKAGVVQRHAEQRGAASALQGEPPDSDADADEDDMPAGPIGRYDYQASKAKREHFAAERELTAHRKEARELIEVAEHIAAFAKAGALVRSSLETWATTLPPQLFGRDEASIRATIADQVEQLLRELAAQLGEMAAEAEGGA